MQNLKTIVALLSLIILPALAGCTERSTLDVGGREIVVPVPSGLNRLGNNAPKFRQFIQKSLSSDFILIEYYLTKDDLRDVINGHSNHRSKSFSLSVPIAMYGHNFSEGDFLRAVVETRAIGGGYVASSEVAQNERNESDAQKSGSVPILLSGSQWLGVFYESHDAIGTATAQHMHVGAILVTRVTASIKIRVRDRFVVLGCSSEIQGNDAVHSTEIACSNWAQDILKANSTDID